MKIIVPRIPSTVTRKQLSLLSQEVLDQKFHLPFTKRPKILSVKIFSITDLNGVDDHHGLITIDPYEAGKWFIDHFRKQQLGGKQAFAREYVERTHCDPAFNYENDRRRPKLEHKEVKGIQVASEGMDRFRREYK
jgi:hypothetical protein